MTTGRADVERSVTIYALCEPDTGDVRYVGKTHLPLAQRLRTHRPEDTDKGRWLQRLAERGLRPDARVLEMCAESEWADAERRWIAHFRELRGAALLNIREGGETPCIRPHSGQITLRLAPDERAYVDEQAERAGGSVSKYVRQLIRRDAGSALRPVSLDERAAHLEERLAALEDLAARAR